MIDLSLPYFRRARIWLDEERPARLVDGARECVTLRPGQATLRRREVAAEVAVPYGAHVGYGLLGASYATSDGDPAIVLAQSGTLRAFSSDLVHAPESVTVGLPPELAGGVRDAMVRAGGTEVVPPSGVITFDCAAYGEIGSSTELFERMALLVARLLATDVTALDTVTEIVEGCLM